MLAEFCSIVHFRTQNEEILVMTCECDCQAWQQEVNRTCLDGTFLSRPHPIWDVGREPSRASPSQLRRHHLPRRNQNPMVPLTTEQVGTVICSRHVHAIDQPVLAADSRKRPSNWAAAAACK